MGKQSRQRMTDKTEEERIAKPEKLYNDTSIYDELKKKNKLSYMFKWFINNEKSRKEIEIKRKRKKVQT